MSVLETLSKTRHLAVIAWSDDLRAKMVSYVQALYDVPLTVYYRAADEANFTSGTILVTTYKTPYQVPDTVTSFTKAFFLCTTEWAQLREAALSDVFRFDYDVSQLDNCEPDEDTWVVMDSEKVLGFINFSTGQPVVVGQ